MRGFAQQVHFLEETLVHSHLNEAFRAIVICCSVRGRFLEALTPPRGLLPSLGAPLPPSQRTVKQHALCVCGSAGTAEVKDVRAGEL